MLMQKGFGVIYILIGIVILALLIPTPEYKETVTSCPAVYGTDAKCGTEKGWVIGKPLLWRMIIQATLKPPVQTNSPVPQSQNNETADWKTYTNTKNGYSLKYPPTWTATEHGAPAFGADVTLLPPDSVFPQAYISIQTLDNPQNLSVLDFIKKEILPMPENMTIEQWDSNHSIKEIIVDGKAGVFRYPKRAGEGGWEVFVLYAANKISRIDLIPQNDVISMQIFNQILSTFKFLN